MKEVLEQVSLVGEPNFVVPCVGGITVCSIIVKENLEQKIELAKKTYKNIPEIMETIEIYEFFKRCENLPKVREHEFRKDVRLRINDNGEEVIVNLDQLKEYARILESFISYIKVTLMEK